MPPIKIIEHALERMKQRGVSESEVRNTVNTGNMDIAKYGRVKYTKSFNLKDTQKKKSYNKKIVTVYAEKTGSQIDVISVLVKFY